MAAFWAMGALLLWAILRSLPLSAPETLSLAAGMAMLPWVLTGLAALTLWQNLPLRFYWSAPLLMLLTAALLQRLRQQGSGKALRLALLMGALALLRPLSLALPPNPAILPGYFDSVLHTHILQTLNASPAALPWQTTNSPLPGYYHLGYHLWAAAMQAILQIPAPQILLHSASLLLISLPLALYFPVHRQTRSQAGALFALLLAGWGWEMPEHALQWGKFPLLASLPLLVSALSLGVYARKKGSRAALILATLGMVAAALTHSRSLPFALLLLLSLWLGQRWRSSPPAVRWLAVGLLMATLLAQGYRLETDTSLRLALNPYLHEAPLLSLLVLLLLPLSFSASPAGAFAALFSMSSLLQSLYAPFVTLPGRDYAQTLLDRPFVQTALFLPLAFLGGLGFAGLLRRLPARWRGAGGAGLLLLTLALIPWGARIEPTDCCQIFGREDAAALEWMRGNLPSEAKILIAAVPLSVQDGSPQQISPSDGGAWISVLAGWQTIPLLNTTDFGSPQTWQSLCAQGVTHLYAGGLGQTFNVSSLQSLPGWYAPQLILPGAKVWRLQGCPVQVR